MSTKRNIIANVGGRVWLMLMSFLFVPFYIHLIGIEAYGLIGFFTTMLAVLFVLDLGLSTTVSRELAALATRANARGDARDLLRSMEVIYWAAGAAMSLVVLVAAPYIAEHWLNARQLAPDSVVTAVRLMALCLFLRWPVALYSGALMGQHRHGPLNAVLAVMALLQGGGAVLVLWLVQPTITAFFVWQALVSAMQIVLLQAVSWRALPLADHRPRLQGALLGSIARFSAGVSAIGILSVVLTQLDKFVLSRLLTLDQFGYYVLASVIAQTLIAPASAIHGAIFPSLARLAAEDDTPGLSALYHRASQLMATVLFPAACALAFFSGDLLTVYLQDPATVAETWRLVSLFAVGNALLGIMMLPYALQLACGWTRLSLIKNVVAVALYVPVMLVAVDRLGVIGAPIGWLLLCLGYFLIEVTVMHRRLLPGEQWRWYWQDVGGAAALSAVILGATRLAVPAGTPPLLAVLGCGIGAGLAVLACGLALPAMRHQMRGYLGRTAAFRAEPL